jgi:hypothetical protein
MCGGLITTAAGVLLLPVLVLGQRPTEIPAARKADACGSFGTRVEFVATPSEAAALARKEQKLVFVLHVSGNFEDPRFT